MSLEDPYVLIQRVAQHHVPEAVGEGGTPVHRRGLTPAPGLYFLGMHNQYSRGSSLIGFVRHDASFIVGRVRERLAARPRRS